MRSARCRQPEGPGTARGCIQPRTAIVAMPSVIRNGRNAGASVEVAAMTGLFEAARQLQAFCDRQGWRSCFIGGIAVQRWGEPRVTRDVDLTLLTGFGGEERIHRQAARRVPRSNRQCARVCAPAPRTSAQDSRRAGNRYISRCAAVRRKSGRPRIGLFLWPRSFDPNMLSRRSDRVETVRIAPPGHSRCRKRRHSPQRRSRLELH